ncbi:hypothetical protein EVB81_201 [Rhizobium phage RHph_I46]|uniref:Uncharacterized protein n=1 Tax=Rhizobium phage RHph_I1_9 TaxID=2509729 RepID=A0A7S5RDT1_9CAUD|nr:hypothetical protein PP936_gp199 [Rhizobium phage RHph_I1_9]QIG69770.1 hypothetical protein EVB81_201 [Rhizobium phage RHph_I46]QIG71051.1 hypothetical protein EVB92_201 [Rhizobium phage RHph_I9]QIG73636.1 hypothetical protein EVC04_199 [Rhizobium phage RHph_I1_9]QIG76390.1 hypothetical protein EVC25_201 [Rhizobium phage RHph_I34]
MRYEQAVHLVEVGLALWEKETMKVTKDVYMTCYAEVVGLLNGRKLERDYEKNLQTCMTMAICDDSAVRTDAEVILDWLVNSGFVCLENNVH